VAVSSSDQRVDCVGACVGVRGNRIKNIVDELGGERIDIVRWDDDLEIFIPNALQPAEVEQVILCKMLGRAIVLVREDQLSLAIGRRGQNVRLASKLSGWDIEIMTQEELAESIDRAVQGFSSLEGMTVELSERLVEEGYLSYDDLSVIEPDALMEMGGLSAEQVDAIVEQAESRAEEAEAAAAEARRAKREEDRKAALEAAKAPPETDETAQDETQDETQDSSDTSAETTTTQEESTQEESTQEESETQGDGKSTSTGEVQTENNDEQADTVEEPKVAEAGVVGDEITEPSRHADGESA